MILHKETYKKFGYWPRYLPQQSSKHYVVCECDVCGSIFDRTIYKVNRIKKYDRKDLTCKRCAQVLNGKRANLIQKTKRERQALALKDVSITPTLWFEMFSSYSMKPDKGDSNPCMCISQGSSKPTVLNSIKTAVLLRSLNASFIPKNKPQLKTILFRFLESQPLSFRMRVASILASKSGSKRPYENRPNRWHIICNPEKNCRIFDIPGFQYRKGSGAIVIYEGSFFIDGRWVHIG